MLELLGKTTELELDALADDDDPGVELEDSSVCDDTPESWQEENQNVLHAPRSKASALRIVQLR